MLDSYIVTLPDGSQGNLLDFYNGIMDESIQATDAGYVLSDGSLVPTNGEAMWNPDADVLVALMSPYLSDGGQSRSGDDDDSYEDSADYGDDYDSPPHVSSSDNLWRFVGIAAIAYIIFGKSNLKF